MKASYWWFKIRFWLFYRLTRLALWMVPEHNDDWFMELLKAGPEPTGERELHSHASDVEGQAAILLIEQHPDGTRSSVKLTLPEAEGIFMFATGKP